jgi:hypothetical protein
MENAVGFYPMVPTRGLCHVSTMDIILLLIASQLLFAGTGFYFGGPIFGASVFALILMVSLAIYFMGGFRRDA